MNKFEWTRITKPHEIDEMTDDLEFCLTVNVVTKSGTNYYDENFPLTRDELKVATDDAAAVVDVLGGEGVTQVGNTFIDTTQMESVEGIIYYRSKQ